MTYAELLDSTVTVSEVLQTTNHHRALKAALDFIRIIFFRLISEKKLNKKKIKIFISTELKMPSVSKSQILPLNIKCRDEKFKWEQCNKKLKTFICSRKFRSFELFSSCFVFAFFCKNFFVIERKKRDVDDFNSSKYLQTFALKRKKSLEEKWREI